MAMEVKLVSVNNPNNKLFKLEASIAENSEREELFEI